MKLIVSGSRNGYDNDELVLVLTRYLNKYGESLIIIEGCADGVDTQAWEWARRVNVPVIHYPAPWKHLERRGGAWRNRAMLTVALADGVVCFHNDIAHSRGTRDMAIAAHNRGLTVHMVGSTMEL